MSTVPLRPGAAAPQRVQALAAAAGVPVCAAAGVLLFAWPFLGLPLPAYSALIAAVTALLLLATGMEMAARQLDARLLALLATLAALDSALRLALVTGIGGFTLIFLLILCAGAALGARFGFLCGAFSLLVSALVTGGVGPWLPYEMVAAGWVGAAAGLVTPPRDAAPTRARVIALAVVGVVMGYVYGVAMDTWDWSFFRSTPDLGWVPGMPTAEALTHFARFYLASSLAYDTLRALGNAVLVLALGRPILLALTRLRRRLTVEITEPAG